MANPTPKAGVTHNVVIKWSNDSKTKGFMLPGGDLKLFSMQPYNAFAPQSRQGEATIKDLSLLATWELAQDWSGGVGQLKEPKVETNKYALAVGTPSLYTAHRGRLVPPPGEYSAGGTDNKIFKQFIEFLGVWFALTNESTGEVYFCNSTGTTWTDDNAGLSTAAKQMYHDGATLYVTQGASNAVRVTTTASSSTGGSWADISPSINADFIVRRENNGLAYVAGATFTPGGSEGYAAVTVGWTGTTATNMVYYKGACWIGKPEGLYSWAKGAIEDRLQVGDQYSTSNFTKMVVHKNLLFFNIGSRLMYTDGKEYMEVFPDDPNGFVQIDSLTSTFGPLVIGGRLDMDASDDVVDYQGGLFTYDGPDRPNLNPLYMSAQQASSSSTASPGTIANVDSPGGGTAWSDTANAAASDNAYASSTGLTKYLQCTNFGFAIPTGAVVTGVTCTLEWKYALGASPSSVFMYGTLFTTGPTGGRQRVFTNPTFPGFGETSAETTETLGSATDLWYLNLTPSLVNSANFGISIHAAYAGNVPTHYVDHVQLTVYYYIPYTFIAAGATSVFDSSGTRLYFCESSTIGTKYLDLTNRYEPKTYTTETAKDAYVQLTEFAGGFRALKKWYYTATLSVDNPNSTTYAELWYSVDEGTWTQTVDETGTVLTMTLDSTLETARFPLNTSGSKIQLRLYVWTTTSSASAHVTHLTLKGIVYVKPRYQISFPVDCGEDVMNQRGNARKGEAVREDLLEICAQLYPVKLQDPWGVWHLCAPRPPSPLFAVRSFEVPSGSGISAVRPFSVAQMVLMEIDELSSTGGFNAWTAS